LWISGAIVRGLAGPIVHFAHGQRLKALISFVIEGVVPGVVLAAAPFGPAARHGAADFFFLFIIFPITSITGSVVDTAVLAKKEVKPEPEKGPAISLAPLVVPKLRPNSGTPVGLSLVGQF